MIHPDTTLVELGPPLCKGIVATRPIPKGTFTYVRDALDVTLTPAQWEALPELLREQSDTYDVAIIEGGRPGLTGDRRLEFGLTVAVPAGVDTGARLRLSGEGNSVLCTLPRRRSGHLAGR